MASQPAARSSQLSRLRGAQLASAAQASLRASVSAPRAAIARPGTNPYLASGTLGGDDGDQEMLHIARYERRSRASRLGNKRMGMVRLPDALQDAVESLVAASDKTLLRTDYLRHRTHLAGSLESFGSSKPLPSARAALLHLTSSSPGRYSALLNVLQETKQRLSIPLPDLAIPHGPEGVKLHQDSGWQPRKVVEYSSAAAEGLWAAAEVFGTPVTDAGTAPSATVTSGSLQEYEGIEPRVPLLRVGMDLAIEPVAKSAVQLVETQKEVAEDEDALEYGDPDDDVPEMLSSSLSSVHKSFRSKRDGTSLSGKHSGPTPNTPANPSETLALSSFAMASMSSDAARRQHIDMIWRSGAHTIVLLERGDARGFSCIASARAQLLELGKKETQPKKKRGGEVLKIGKHTFFEEVAPEDDQAGTAEAEPADPSAGCHVVAPCPHDRPCPLLNPFVPEASTEAPRSRPPGFATCSFSQRVQRPSYTRKTKHAEQSDENIVYSYLVVRRGQRPAFEHLGSAPTKGDTARPNDEVKIGSSTSNDTATRELWQRLWRAAAMRTKEGDLDALRAGSAVKESSEGSGPSLRVLEEVLEDLSVDEAADNAARQELLALLPDILRSEAANEGVELRDEEIQQALQEALRPRNDAVAPLPSPATTPSATESPDLIEASPSDVDFLSPPLEAAAMALASYTWPRLIKPPLKKGGHVTFDACCASGDIQRFTIAKSAGRQPYQDARKASWGDLFPHGPATAEENLGDMGEVRTVLGKSTVRIAPASDQLLASAVERARGTQPLSGAAARAAAKQEDLAVEEEEKAEARALGWREDESDFAEEEEEDDDEGMNDLWLSDEEILKREEAKLAQQYAGIKTGAASAGGETPAKTAYDPNHRPPAAFTRIDLPESSMIGPDALSIPLAPPLADGTPRRNAVERDTRALSDVGGREKRRKRAPAYTSRGDRDREAGKNRKERKEVRESRKMSRGDFEALW